MASVLPSVPMEGETVDWPYLIGALALACALVITFGGLYPDD